MVWISTPCRQEARKKNCFAACELEVVQEAAAKPDAIRRFMNFVGDEKTALIAHNAAFDLRTGFYWIVSPCHTIHLAHAAGFSCDAAFAW